MVGMQWNNEQKILTAGSSVARLRQATSALEFELPLTVAADVNLENLRSVLETAAASERVFTVEYAELAIIYDAPHYGLGPLGRIAIDVYSVMPGSGDGLTIALEAHLSPDVQLDVLRDSIENLVFRDACHVARFETRDGGEAQTVAINLTAPLDRSVGQIAVMAQSIRHLSAGSSLTSGDPAALYQAIRTTGGDVLLGQYESACFDAKKFPYGLTADKAKQELALGRVSLMKGSARGTISG